MFAVVDIMGFQELVRVGDKIRVPLLKDKEGASVTFEKVLLIGTGKDKDLTVGAPHVSGKSVTVKILKHGQTAKVRTAKFKRRKRQTKFSSHRQDYTEVEVTGIK